MCKNNKISTQKHKTRRKEVIRWKKKVILTQEGHDNLEKELNYLKTEKRAEIAERIKSSIRFGDLSENSEYDEAKMHKQKTK